MKVIYAFLAGSTYLEKERDTFKIIVSDINQELEPRGFHLRLRSCDDFKNKQEDYNDYITKKSDLVIFVVNDVIKTETVKEFTLASKRRAKEGKPDILFFLKDYKEDSNAHSFIKGLLSSINEDYWVEYNNLEDLKLKGKDKLRVYLNEYKQKRSLSLKPNITKRSIFSIFGFIIALVIAFILGLGINGTKFTGETSSKPVLLITGGGSAANYIEQYCLHYPVKNFKGGYYVHMPSSNSWLMLEEEAITPQDKDGVRYYPICVSAEQATDSNFITRTSKDRFLSVGSVISITLGQDTLMTCLKNTSDLLSHVNTSNSGYITIAELSDIIQNDIHYKVNIFTTSKGSGTRDAYVREIDKYVSLSGKDTDFFADNSDLPTVNKDDEPYVLLESKCYTMQAMANEIKNGHAIELLVKRDDGSFVTKPIVLYFMAYCVDNTNTLKVPRQTTDFLRAIGIDYSRKIKDGYLKRYSDDKIILNYNDLPEF